MCRRAPGSGPRDRCRSTRPCSRPSPAPRAAAAVRPRLRAVPRRAIEEAVSYRQKRTQSNSNSQLQLQREAGSFEYGGWRLVIGDWKLCFGQYTGPSMPTLPMIPLFPAPSPIQEMDGLRRALGGGPRLLVKRDDALPFAFGGNRSGRCSWSRPTHSTPAPTR